MEFTPRDLIVNSHYGEFPDAVITLRLAARIAVLDSRLPEDAMRVCAGMMARRVTNQKLKFALLEMVISDYPQNILVDILKTIKQMAQHLGRDLGRTIEADNKEQLVQMLFQPRNKHPLENL